MGAVVDVITALEKTTITKEVLEVCILKKKKVIYVGYFK